MPLDKVFSKFLPKLIASIVNRSNQFGEFGYKEKDWLI